MKDYLLDVMQQQEHGLYLCELPTGNGKTFDSAQAMKEYADSIGDDTKIIYLTTLNKNLPEDALRAAYGSEELYKRNVLRLRSNFDEVVEKILEIEVPEEMKTDAYLKLCKDVSLYRNAVDKRYADKEYIKELADRITEGDRQLRYEITKRLKNKFQTKTQRKKAIRTDAKYKWIGKLYPAVFTDDYKIILMSVSKFKQRDLLMGETCQMIRNNRELILEDRSFYQVGMEYYEFEDNDSHHDNTNLKFVKVYDTPEKIMLYLAGKAIVFGISATAEVDTVVGNYDLRYLKEQLKERFHKTPGYLKDKTRTALEKRWSAYADGEINVHGEVISSNIQGFNAEDYCKTFMDAEFARYASNIITNITDKEYQIIRYCNVLKAMRIFNRNEDIQSMLYLGMALPKKDNPGMDEGVLQQLFEYSQMGTQQSNSSVCFLKGDNFEQDKEELQQRLSCGEKIFVMSSYQTIGAGQNLQYKIPKGREVVQLGEFIEGDKRFLYKDFDALYLGNITNMTVNTYQDEKITSHGLLQMLFQIEELYENGEMNYSEKDQMLKLAFRSYTGSDQFTLNKLYKLKSVVVQASRMVLQAVGRMCRTFVKSPDIYLFVESELLEKLYVGELKKRILPPEMKAIVDMCESLGKDYLPEENFMLNKAEKISSVGLWTIRRMLAKDWTAESMQLWEQLRMLVLQYPTASTYDWQNNEYLQKLYITSGEKRNQYIYSQYSDFNDVTIDFGNDKVAFKNSKRAKIKGDSDEVAIYEMSEKESGLPAILRYPGMKAHFEEMGYALKFEMNEYLLSPVLFHNIYKGALGEAAGMFILNRELGIELSPITEPEYFEFFDYKLSDDVYVDFKNWKFTYVQERDEIRKDILRKLESIGAKRVYIINVVSDKNYKPSAIVDLRLVEIPMLIREDGTVCYENLHMIRKEDFENVN